MTIAYASFSALTQTSGTTATLNKPTGTASGDLLIFQAYWTGGGTVTPPAGWNTITTVAGVFAYWKVAGGSEPATYDFTKSVGTGNWISHIARLTGAHPTAPIENTSSVNSGGNNGILPSITITSAKYLWQMIGAFLNSATWTPPGTTTEDYDATTSPGPWPTAGGHEVNPAAGATGTRTWVLSGIGGNKGGLMVGLIEAPPPAQTVSPGGIDSSATLGSPTLSAGAVAVQPGGIAPTEAVGSPTILAGVTIISPNGIAPTTAFGTPTIPEPTPPAQTIQPTGIGPTSAVGSPILSIVAPDFCPEWGVLLNGVYLSGCGECDEGSQWDSVRFLCPDIGQPTIMGDLPAPPDGLGLPAQRVEDVSYVQRDGVKHYSDWYEPRIITLDGVTVCPDGCPNCPGARQKVREILKAWKRQCEDVELVIYTDCHGQGTEMCAHEFGEGPFGECAFGGEHPEGMSVPDRSLVGPFGVIGRPRVAEVQWDGASKCATLLLRFDGVDQRMYVLDECGNPGSGGECITLEPGTLQKTRCYDTDGKRCYPRCYPNESGEPANIGYAANVGTICAPLTITLYGGLSTPYIENLSTGERIDYNGYVRATDPPVIIDTSDGTATQGGASVTHLLSGDIYMEAEPGQNMMRLGTYSPSDGGHADVCWRPAVEMA